MGKKELFAISVALLLTAATSFVLGIATGRAMCQPAVESEMSNPPAAEKPLWFLVASGFEQGCSSADLEEDAR